MIFKIILVLVIASGIVAVPISLYRASLLLSTESIQSPRVLVRWMYRYFSFCLYFLISFFSSFVLLAPVIRLINSSNLSQEAKGVLYLAISLPIAFLGYWLDYKHSIKSDRKKIEGRKKIHGKSSRF